MKFRTFGNTGWQVSEIGLGCWQLGDKQWGEVTEDSARAILRTAYESGVTFFDTADVYGDGRSERLVGEFAREVGGVRVATKVGRAGIFPDRITRETLREAVLASGKRLAVDRIDLVQLHCIPTHLLEGGDVFVWLEEFRTEGLVAHYGASVETLAEAHLCLRDPGLASLQIIFNLFRQQPVSELFPAARARNVALIVRLPLASGLLGGKMNRARTFAPTDHRWFNREGAVFHVGETFSGLGFEGGLDAVEIIRPLLPSHLPMAAAAQRWILDHPEVTTVITGATHPNQVAANCAVSSLPPLTPETHARLAAAAITHIHPRIRGAV